MHETAGHPTNPTTLIGSLLSDPMLRGGGDNRDYGLI